MKKNRHKGTKAEGTEVFILLALCLITLLIDPDFYTNSHY